MTTRDYYADYIYYPNVNLGANIEFNSKIDMYILTAERVIDEAQLNIYFYTGPDGTINLTFDEGALFESANGILGVSTEELAFYSNGDITFDAGDTIQVTAQNILMTAEGFSDGKGSIIWGDPAATQSQAGNNNNIAFTTQNVLNFYTNYLDITNSVALEIPRYTNSQPIVCNGQNEGALYFVSIFPWEYLCTCMNEVAGWNYFPAPYVFTESVCFPFRDIISYY